MTLYCYACLTDGSMVEAVTVIQGHAACVRHFAHSISNPTHADSDILPTVEQAFRDGRRANAVGDAVA